MTRERPSWLKEVEHIRSASATAHEGGDCFPPTVPFVRPPVLEPIDDAKVDAAYRRWSQAERKRFLDRVDALEADGLDIGKARDQAFRELTGPTN